MATRPSLPDVDVEREILDVISEYHVRPGYAVPLGTVHFKVQQRGFPADEINSALQSMQEKDWLKSGSLRSMIVVTETAFKANPDLLSIPSPEEVESAVLGAISEYGVQAGGTVPLGGLHGKLQPHFIAEEINTALVSLEQKGWIEAASATMIRLKRAA